MFGCAHSMCVCLSVFSLAGPPSRAAMAPGSSRSVLHMLISDPHKLVENVQVL